MPDAAALGSSRWDAHPTRPLQPAGNAITGPGLTPATLPNTSHRDVAAGPSPETDGEAILYLHEFRCDFHLPRGEEQGQRGLNSSWRFSLFIYRFEQVLSAKHTPTKVCQQRGEPKMAGLMEVLPRCPSSCIWMGQVQTNPSPELLAGLLGLAIPNLGWRPEVGICPTFLQMFTSPSLGKNNRRETILESHLFVLFRHFHCLFLYLQPQIILPILRLFKITANLKPSFIPTWNYLN